MTTFYSPLASRLPEPSMLDYFWNYDQIAMADELDYQQEADLDLDLDLDLDFDADADADAEDAKAAVLELSPLIAYQPSQQDLLSTSTPSASTFTPAKQITDAQCDFPLPDFDYDPYFYCPAPALVPVPVSAALPEASDAWPAAAAAAGIARPDSPTLPSPAELEAAETSELSIAADQDDEDVQMLSDLPFFHSPSPASTSSVPELASDSSGSAASSPASSPAHSRKNSRCAGPGYLSHHRLHTPASSFQAALKKHSLASQKVNKTATPTMKQRRRSSATPATPSAADPAGLLLKERTPHTEVERKYRQGINGGINELGFAVPEIRSLLGAGHPDHHNGRGAGKVKAPSKLAILRSATKYIGELAGRSDEAEGRCVLLERERERDRRRMAELETRLAVYEKCI